MENFYVYVYLDPRKKGKFEYGKYQFECEPFYVGKGKDDRWKDLINGRNPHFINKYNKIKESGLEPITVKIKDDMIEDDSFLLEIELIETIGREDLEKGTLVNFTNGGDGCSGYIFSEETIESRSEKTRKDFSIVKQKFEAERCILLTEEKDYKNAFTKLDYICRNNHKHSISWANFQQEHGCPICAGQKIYFSEIKRAFEEKKCILLTEEKDYKNNHQKLKYICPEGHENSITWSNFQQEHGCYICGIELQANKMKGKNSILIIQDVVQIKLLLKDGKLTQRKISQIFEISYQTISLIKNKKIWGYIKL